MHDESLMDKNSGIFFHCKKFKVLMRWRNCTIFLYILNLVCFKQYKFVVDAMVHSEKKNHRGKNDLCEPALSVHKGHIKYTVSLNEA